MKRKITWSLLAVLLVCGLSYGLDFLFGIFTPYNFWTARQDLHNGTIQIVSIGEMPLHFEQKQKLANHYGFHFQLTGCEVTSNLINGSKYYNNIVIDHLESKFGKGWWTKFQSQLDSIDNAKRTELIEEEVLALVERQKNVKDKIWQIDSLSKGQRHISLLATLNDTAKNIYLVKVGENNGVNFVTYYNFLVDANTMEIINMNSTNGQSLNNHEAKGRDSLYHQLIAGRWHNKNSTIHFLKDNIYFIYFKNNSKDSGSWNIYKEMLHIKPTPLGIEREYHILLLNNNTLQYQLSNKAIDDSIYTFIKAVPKKSHS